MNINEWMEARVRMAVRERQAEYKTRKRPGRVSYPEELEGCPDLTGWCVVVAIHSSKAAR